MDTRGLRTTLAPLQGTTIEPVVVGGEPNIPIQLSINADCDAVLGHAVDHVMTVVDLLRAYLDGVDRV